MQVVSLKKRQLIKEYLKAEEGKRLPLAEFLKVNKIYRPIFYQVEAELKKELVLQETRAKDKLKVEEAVAVERRKHTLAVIDSVGAQMGDYDSMAVLQKRNAEVDECLLEAVNNGNVKAMELFYEITGRKVKKTESKVTVELTGDDLYRIRNKARESIPGDFREINGDRKVLLEPGILLGEVCLGTEQDESSEGEVAELVVSDGLTEGIRGEQGTMDS